MRKFNMILAVTLLASVCSLEASAVNEKKRGREENENVEPGSPLGIGTHLCRVDHGFKTQRGRGAPWRRQPGDELLQTAYLPCNIVAPRVDDDEQQVVVQILPEGAYYAPYHRPIVLAHDDVIAANKFRRLRKLQIGIHVFAQWEGQHEENAPKLWEAEVVRFNIATKTARIRWVFTGGEHVEETEKPFEELFHVPH